MIRPTTRVCHSRQDIALGKIPNINYDVKFEKNPARWAATPKFRLQLHKELEDKLAAIARYRPTAPKKLNRTAKSKRAIVASGVAAAHTKDVLKELKIWSKIPFYQVIQPFPLHTKFIDQMIEKYEEILVIEETMGVIEMQLADRYRIKGKMSATVPKVGELSPEKIEQIVSDFVGLKSEVFSIQSPPGRRPTLCPGCPHRASFFAIKKAAPRGI